MNVALVGYGFAGSVFHAPVIARVDGLRLHTIVTSRDVEFAAGLGEPRRVKDLQVALEDPEVALVVVAVPNDLHAPLAMQALDAGKHVVVDKPFALNVAEAERIVERARAKGRIVSVFQNRRWDGDFMTLRRLYDEGALGDVVEVLSHWDRYRPQVPARWRDQPGLGGGLWIDLGPHLVDQSLCLFGEPESIEADIGRQRDGALVDDYFRVTLRYGRRRVTLHSSSLAAAGDVRFVVHGTRASYVKRGIDPQEDLLKRGIYPGDAAWTGDPIAGELVIGADGERRAVPTLAGDYRAYYAQMRDAVLGKAPAPVTADEALRVMRVLEAARGSSRDPA